MTIRISISIFVLLLSVAAVAQQAPSSKAHLTPAQLQEFRLKEIDEAIHEKAHPAENWDVPQDKVGSMESEAIGEGKVSTSSPESEVHAAINPRDTSNIVVSPIHNGNGQFYMPIYYTTNFGSSWSKSTFSPKPTIGGVTVTGGGDPLFAYDADGKLYYTWIDTYLYSSSSDTTHGAIYWAFSTDKGKTWQRAANHDTVTTNWTKYKTNFQIDRSTGFDDKEWLAVDRTNSPYHNTLYMAWSRLGKDDGAVMLARKLPGVDSFEAPVRVSSPTLVKIQYTSIGIDAHGGIHVTYMGTEDLDRYGIYHAYSADGGKTFNPEVLVSYADVPNQSGDAIGEVLFGIRINGNYPCPHLSIDTANSGNLYMVWNAYGTDANLGTGSQVYFSRSTDNGTSWSDTIRINNDNQNDNVIDHFFPSIAVNGKGVIFASWYDRREDPNNQIGRYYLGRSTDFGQTWTNAPIASKGMNFAHVQDKNGGSTYGFGIGEYTQILVTPSYVIPVWSDDRTDNGSLLIYTSFIQGASALPSGAVAPDRVSSIDGGLSLQAVYPNPAGGIVHCSFALDNRAHVNMTVVDLRGDLMSSIFDETATAGVHDVTFDVSHLANGTYYLSLESDRGYVSRAFTVSH